MAREPFAIGGETIRPGSRREILLPVTRLVTGAQVSIPILVLHGRKAGPTVWLDAAIHGDEVCGVEIIRRVLAGLSPRSIAGTLIAVPIVNVHGFMQGERYLPDRRDLNRSFPGSSRGSLASMIAHLMMTEVVARCEVGIDLHTGSDHRSNLPQIRADLDDPETRHLAVVFGAPIMIHAETRDGSLRHAAGSVGARVLLYEGGEAWRFDAEAIDAGVTGVRRVLAEVGMIQLGEEPAAVPRQPIESRRTGWVRASRSGILQLSCELGERVESGELLGVIYDSFGKRHGRVRANRTGLVIGRSSAPLVNRGDALVHVAETDSTP
jgi:predicted deacylase